jgi:hypothetical protein
MVTYTKFEQTMEDVAHKVHDFSSDNLEIALCNEANAPDEAADAVLADIVPIAYTNLPTSRVLTTTSSGHTGGLYTLVIDDKLLTATGTVAGFRYVVVFNQDSATPDDALLGFFDYGSDLVLNSGESLNVDFGADGPTDGALFTLQ